MFCELCPENSYHVCASCKINCCFYHIHQISNPLSNKPIYFCEHCLIEVQRIIDILSDHQYLSDDDDDDDAECDYNYYQYNEDVD